MPHSLLSKIVLGTVQMGLNYGINNSSGQIGESEAMQILLQAHAHGINYLDTAAAYGKAHEVIGHFHQLHPEIKFKVNTKFPHEFSEPAASLVAQYLEELNIARLETIFFHSYQSFEAHRQCQQGLEALKKDQAINHIGVSVYTNKEAEAILQEDWVDVIQLPYNMLDNYSQRGDIIHRARLENKIVQSRSTFLQGLFFIDQHKAHPVVEKMRDDLQRLDVIAEEYGVSKYALAILYCFANKEIAQILIGVDSLVQLEDLFSIRNIELSPEMISKIDHIKTRNIELLNPSNWNKI